MAWVRTAGSHSGFVNEILLSPYSTASHFLSEEVTQLVCCVTQIDDSVLGDEKYNF